MNFTMPEATEIRVWLPTPGLTRLTLENTKVEDLVTLAVGPEDEPYCLALAVVAGINREKRAVTIRLTRRDSGTGRSRPVTVELPADGPFYLLTSPRLRELSGQPAGH